MTQCMHQAGITALKSDDEASRTEILAVINRAAKVYRGVIPDECYQTPYMSDAQLAGEIADGVSFIGYGEERGLTGVMGVQRRGNVNLIRHAYVWPDRQGRGIGSMLLQHLCERAPGQVLVGTWRSAAWAIRFYERHAFKRVKDETASSLLRTYWTVPERQMASSIVLALRPVIAETLRVPSRSI